MRPYPTQTPILKTRGVTLATTQVSNRLQRHFWWPVHALSKRPLQRTGRKRSTEPPRVPVVSVLQITERTPLHSPRGLVLQLTHVSLPGKGCWDLRPVTDQEGAAGSLQPAVLQRATLQTGGSRCSLNGSPLPCFSPTATGFRSKEESSLTLSVRSRSCTFPAHQVLSLTERSGTIPTMTVPSNFSSSFLMLPKIKSFSNSFRTDLPRKPGGCKHKIPR